MFHRWNISFERFRVNSQISQIVHFSGNRYKCTNPSHSSWAGHRHRVPAACPHVPRGYYPGVEAKKDASILGTKDTCTPPDLKVKVAKERRYK